MDLLACRREHPPGRAELIDALARRLARLPVGYEVIERVTVVRDLELAVRPLCRTEQGSAHAGTGDRFPSRDERRPQSGARVVARAPGAFVLDEVVERYPLAVDEDAAQGRLRNGDPGSAGLRTAGCRGRRDHRECCECGEQLDPAQTVRGHGPCLSGRSTRKRRALASRSVVLNAALAKLAGPLGSMRSAVALRLEQALLLDDAGSDVGE